jgi:hypothetical protein
MKAYGLDSGKNVRPVRPGCHFRAGTVAIRALTFSQAPQAVRSARGGWGWVPTSTAVAGRTLQTDKCNTFGPTTDVHRPGNVSGTATVRAVFRIHSLPPQLLALSTTSGPGKPQTELCYEKRTRLREGVTNWRRPSSSSVSLRPRANVLCIGRGAA